MYNKYMDVPVLISVATTALSIGFAMGTLSIQFVSTKQCERYRADVWKRTDAVYRVLAGGKHRFDVRLIPENGGNRSGGSGN